MLRAVATIRVETTHTNLLPRSRSAGKMGAGHGVRLLLAAMTAMAALPAFADDTAPRASTGETAVRLHFADITGDALTAKSDFDLPAQPLGAALRQFADQAGIQILFEEKVVDGLRAPAIKAHESATQVLKTLLNHTDLEFTAKDQTVAVRKKAEVSATTATNFHSTVWSSSANSSVQLAQDNGSPAAQEPAQKTNGDSQPSPAEPKNKPVLEQIVVTGSHIRNNVAGNAAPVTVITSQGIDDRGFKNVFDALNSLTQNTGFTEGADFGNTFTPAANTISLRGLGPNHTLVLFDGRRIADYPIAYDGSVNFVDLSSIPSASIDRIEILNGGASGIYGSDAIAGVVNIILKDHVEGLSLDLKAGSTERGGGTNGRFQAVGGAGFDRLKMVFALELSRTDPIWAVDRPFMNSTTLEGGVPPAVWSRMNVDSGQYVNPPDGCAGFTRDFYASTTLVSRPNGSFCGTGMTRPTYWTTQAGKESQNLYSRVKYELSDQAQIFGDLVLGWNHTWNNVRGPTWTSLLGSTGYFLNSNTGNYEQWTRRFGPEEIGGLSTFNRSWNGFAALAATGVRGDVGLSNWKYELAYSASVDVSRDNRPRLLSTVDSYFLGPQQGTDASGVPIYAPDPARFDAPVTATQFQNLMGRSISKDASWLQTVSLSGNGDLLQLPAGPLGAASVIEWGTQGFSNRADPQINEGVFYNTLPVQKVSGARSRYAAALEFSAPLLSSLNAKGAARLDEYSVPEHSSSKVTYTAALDYHPLSFLRLRGNYATSFRAPDMNYIFESQTTGFYSSTTDYYRCRLANEPLTTCEFANVSPGANFIERGNKELRFENGRSYGFGAVLTPINNLELSVDYWNIRIDDLVTVLDSDTLLRIEANCRTGALDAASAQCVDAQRRIVRAPANAPLNPNGILNILVNPINASLERTDGVDIVSRLQWRWPHVGQFHWTTSYTQVFSHRFKQFASDPEADIIHSFNNPLTADFPNKLTSTLDWGLGNWASTLEINRYGSVVNSASTGFLTPTSFANMSVGYTFNSHAAVSVIVHNLLNTIKRDDSGGWPYYPVGYYFPYGREGWIQFSYRFGD